MSIDVVNEQIRLYAKQLKIPTFAEYEEVIRQADPSLGLSGLLLELMKGECEARQENQETIPTVAVIPVVSSTSLIKVIAI